MNDKNEAIAWLANIKEKYIHGGDEEFDECRRESIDMAIKALRQPQIVRCKDCKHRSKEMYDYYGNPENKVYVCQINDVAKKPNWFCADGETDNAD